MLSPQGRSARVVHNMFASPALSHEPIASPDPRPICSLCYHRRVQYFGQRLEGFYFTGAGWVQRYGSPNVRPPISRGNRS